MPAGPDADDADIEEVTMQLLRRYANPAVVTGQARAGRSTARSSRS
jgi:hypothetical protein